MKPGDFTERKRTTKAGKVVTDKVVRSTSGVEYAIGPAFGSGGVASVFRAFRLHDMKACVFKEYVPSPEILRAHMGIKRNIKKLMVNPLTEEDGKTPLVSFIGPMDKDSLIELPASGGFGYIMELVDTKAFRSVPKLRSGNNTYPDADILCKACINIAKLFKRVHFSGWCYKDINEGNIYINNKTGEVRIIDCDNISVASTKTIKGTDGFMAPEVYITETPDTITDYFSMAVLFYRILVGGWPMDGKKTKKYLEARGLSVQEAAPEIYGSMALFAFDPDDSSNTIRGLKDQLSPQLYEFQVRSWDRLPEEIREGFIKTFSRGLKNTDRHLRATDSEWIRIFTKVESSSLVRCSKCGRTNFGDPRRKLTCIFCGSKLPQTKPAPVPVPAPAPAPVPVPVLKPAAPVPAAELTTVVFRARRDIEPKAIEITAKRKSQLQGAAIYPGLNEGWMEILYSAKRNLLAAVNKSSHTWTVTAPDNSTADCAPGQKVILQPGIKIMVLYHQLQLTVTEIK